MRFRAHTHAHRHTHTCMRHMHMLSHPCAPPRGCSGSLGTTARSQRQSATAHSPWGSARTNSKRQTTGLHSYTFGRAGGCSGTKSLLRWTSTRREVGCYALCVEDVYCSVWGCRDRDVDCSVLGRVGIHVMCFACGQEERRAEGCVRMPRSGMNDRN